MSESTNQSIPITETKTGLKRLSVEYYADFLTQVAKERKPSPIRGLLPLEATPGIISLLAGKPNPSTFPITSLSFSARSPEDSTKETTYTLSESALAQGLQYGHTNGFGELRDWLFGLQAFSHGRERGEGWTISVGSGSQDMIYKAVQALVSDGDPLLVESPVYAGVLPIFQSLHCDLIEVETDANGIMSSSLRSTLENWPAGKRRPKVLYSVPYGCNPTGMTATLERRREVLKLARAYNIIILEDDPYFYLYYGKDPRSPSYFSLEKDELPEVGRVLRFDSLSKILSAGLRIGFASGPEVLLQAIDRHTATCNLQVSSLTQVITSTLLNSWGYEGFKRHTERVAEFYGYKRDVFEAAMKKHLDGLAEWSTPQAGMFFWFKLSLSDDGREHDSEAVIRTRAFNNGVLALPGKVFIPTGRDTAYVRASFSLNPEDEVNEALRRLRESILEARAEISKDS